MIGEILGTTVYLSTFVFAYCTIWCLCKSEQKLNGVTWLLLSFVLELCIGAFVVGVINLVHIPVNLWSVSCINFFLGVFLLYCINKDKKIQKYTWERFDIVSLASLVVVMLVFFGYFKGFRIEMKFFNSDSSVHFKNAMALVRGGHLSGMYFSELWTAMTIKCFIPIVKEINAHKIFTLIDYFMFFLELEMFIVVIHEYAGTIRRKIAAVVIFVVYALGYPMMSYLFSFFYWGMAILLMGTLLLFAKYYQEQQIQRSRLIPFMMVTCHGVTMCYMLFGPLAFVILFVHLTCVYVAENHKLDLSWMVLNVKIFLLPTIMDIYYCISFFKPLAQTNVSVGQVIQTTGGTYAERYLNFSWILPLFVFILVYCIYMRSMDIAVTSQICMTLAVIVFTMLYNRGFISFYYFSKLFYPLWFFGFVVAFQAICIIIERYPKFILLYLLIAFTPTLRHLYRYEIPAVAQNPEMDIQSLDLYGFNYGLYKRTRVQYNSQYLEAVDYVIKELKSEEQVPLLCDIDAYSHCYWYEGITGRDVSEYYIWIQGFSEIQSKLESKDVNYFVVYKDTDIYLENQEYFESFIKVYDNELAMVCNTAD